jgi:hypothetical protein
MCTLEQLDSLRQMPQLHSFLMPRHLSAPALRHLLRPPLPQALQLQRLPRVALDDGAAAVLCNLPFLRNLRCAAGELTDFSFFRRLPQLRSLALAMSEVPQPILLGDAAAAGHFAHIADVEMEGPEDTAMQRL